MKLDRKQDLNVLYQVCVFRADRKNKMTVSASDCLRHFPLLLWNCWIEFNETWQEARSQRPLPSLCFFGSIGKTKWPSWPLIGRDIFNFLWNSWKLLADLSKRWHIVLRCTICGPLGLLFYDTLRYDIMQCNAYLGKLSFVNSFCSSLQNSQIVEELSFLLLCVGAGFYID